MKTKIWRPCSLPRFCEFITFCALCVAIGMSPRGLAAEDPSQVEIGLAVRDITPQDPIWLAGYAARTNASIRADTRLYLQACAMRSGEERVVLVSLDNCEVDRDFTAPVLEELGARHKLKPGAVIVVSSHTHSAPVLEGPLSPMYPLDSEQLRKIREYGSTVRKALAETVDEALANLQPARLEYGVGRANIGINRREFRGNQVVIGHNPDGPVDGEVPVLKIQGANGVIRAVLFGYACHLTSLAGGNDFYVISGDFVAYARQHLEACYPGILPIFMQGMGADQNPSPRGSLLDSRRHGLQLAGAIAGVLNRPMRPIEGALRFSYARTDLPLMPPPSPAKLEEDAQANDRYIQSRARAYLEMTKRGKPLPTAVSLPMACVSLGDDLTFLFMGGEVVVDYALRLKRMFAARNPWTIGYAYEIPCYIPSQRILKEGGYEADGSLVYYGVYGPFDPAVENRVIDTMTALVKAHP
ncbi:MAG TPA: neutral/alkaline non-lysosomal ceramidase N-terminal domain-containing protein [Candidatus Paceibacterota bacterium]|nr:neutral/alkaline non-lysosomal ceramidase N-terminal domain-containing protein [Verrucomicrobiota bacterium]HRY50797.1 neutral/alkaline non-lysosomal ceramidase N-terminal domain-containing protein [Candidatus Paceibacterota bacterium]HSA02422.1 neutral/alkaline non-lysosomal ceramidase N-terminal domain-containing protein [Candidatus Paceibacterota bacterium]